MKRELGTNPSDAGLCKHRNFIATCNSCADEITKTGNVIKGDRLDIREVHDIRERIKQQRIQSGDKVRVYYKNGKEEERTIITYLAGDSFRIGEGSKPEEMDSWDVRFEDVADIELVEKLIPKT